MTASLLMVRDADYGAYAGHAMDPRTPEFPDELQSEREIEADLADETERDPYAIAWWLNNDAGIDQSGPVSVHALRGRDPADLTSAQLLGLVFNDTADPRLIELRERFRTHHRNNIAREAAARYEAQFEERG